MKSDVAGILRNTLNLDEESYNILVNSIKNRVGLYIKNPIVRYFKKRSEDRKSIETVKNVLKRNKFSKAEYSKVIAMVKNDIRLNRRIERLDTMRNLFRYWHVAHLPFAMVMLIIMLVHVAVTLVFGYRWIDGFSEDGTTD